MRALPGSFVQAVLLGSNHFGTSDNEPKNRRIRGPKIGAARRTQFWGRGFTTPVFSSKLYCRNSGPISRPHFWGRETAPFIGPEFAPVQPALVGCAPALVPVTLGSVVVSARGTGGLVRSSSVRVFIMLQ